MLLNFSIKVSVLSGCLICFLFAAALNASTETITLNKDDLNEYIDENIKDGHIYYGLAQFYGGINVFALKDEALIKINKNPIEPGTYDNLLISGRFKVLVIDSVLGKVSFSDNALRFINTREVEGPSKSSDIKVSILTKSLLTLDDGPLYDLKYAHLWSPLKHLSNWTEKIFLSLDGLISKNWGLNIIIFAFIFKFINLPIDILSFRSRQKVNNIKRQIGPLLSAVKDKKIGAEQQHYEFMNIHREVGVSPFYELKPLFFTMLPIPFLIAIFNVLGEAYQLSGQEFLWIYDLGYPDRILDLGFAIPFMGNTVHLLPIIMFFIGLIATLAYIPPNTDPLSLKKQKLNGVLVGALFAIIFYPFPSALILFWVFTTIFGSLFQRFLIK